MKNKANNFATVPNLKLTRGMWSKERDRPSRDYVHIQFTGRTLTEEQKSEIIHNLLTHPRFAYKQYQEND